jgi:hypothetical protein
VPGFLREYAVPQEILQVEGGTGDDRASSCCLASQVLAARLSAAFLVDFHASPFATQCPLGTLQLPVNCEWVDGNFSGIPDEATYQGARDYICGHNGGDGQCGTAVLELLFNDLMKIDRSAAAGADDADSSGNAWVHFKGGWIFFDEFCHGAGPENGSGSEMGSNATQQLHVEVCDVAADFYFSVPPPRTAPQCCAALQVVFEELRLQGLRDFGDGYEPSAATDSGLFLELVEAKTIVVSQPGCLEAFYRTVEHQQVLHEASPLSGRSSLGVYPAVQNRSVFDSFWSESLCWTNLALWPIPFHAQGGCCAAVDVVLSRLLWMKDASMGQAYFPHCPRTRDGIAPTCGFDEVGISAVGADVLPIPDEASFATAVAVVCDGRRTNDAVNDNGGSGGGSCLGDTYNSGGLDAVLASLGIPTLAEFCDDPCRCTARVDPLVPGCGFHDAQHAARPFCYVNRPESCPGALVSSLHAGEAYKHCSLHVDSCQPFTDVPGQGPHMCAAFIADGTPVVVTAGQTLETMMNVDVEADDRSVEAVLIGTAGDVLSPWILESALVSVACFHAHAGILCNTRLKPCEKASAPIPTPASKVKSPRHELRMWKGECELNALMRAAFCQLPVFNSLFESDHATHHMGNTIPVVYPAHCEIDLNPLQATPFCSQPEETGSCFDAEILNLLGGEPMLRDPWHYLGRSLFFSVDSVDPEGESERSRWDAFEAQATAHFDITKAIEYVECPAPFVKNEQLETQTRETSGGRLSQFARRHGAVAAVVATFVAAQTQVTPLFGASDISSGRATTSVAPLVVHPRSFYDNRFCTSPCPSFVFSEPEYRFMWSLYVALGLLAFAVNFMSLLRMIPSYLVHVEESAPATKIRAASVKAIKVLPTPATFVRKISSFAVPSSVLSMRNTSSIVRGPPSDLLPADPSDYQSQPGLEPDSTRVSTFTDADVLENSSIPGGVDSSFSISTPSSSVVGPPIPSVVHEVANDTHGGDSTVVASGRITSRNSRGPPSSLFAARIRPTVSQLAPSEVRGPSTTTITTTTTTTTMVISELSTDSTSSSNAPAKATDDLPREEVPKKQRRPTRRHRVKMYNPDTFLLLLSCVLFGCVAILPTALLYHDLPCGGESCNVEACFQTPSVWCVLNRASSFTTQMVVHCLAWKLLMLYFKLVNDYYSWQYHLVNRYGGRMAIVFPLICCAVSYAIEVDDPSHPSYAVHFARSGFICRMRFPSLLAEFALHYGQVVGSAGVVVVVVYKLVRIIVMAFARSRNSEYHGHFRIFGKMKMVFSAMRHKPKVGKIVLLGLTALLMVVLSLSLTVVSASAFATFHASMTQWYDCMVRTGARCQYPCPCSSSSSIPFAFVNPSCFIPLLFVLRLEILTDLC